MEDIVVFLSLFKRWYLAISLCLPAIEMRKSLYVKTPQVNINSFQDYKHWYPIRAGSDKAFKSTVVNLTQGRTRGVGPPPTRAPPEGWGTHGVGGSFNITSACMSLPQAINLHSTLHWIALTLNKRLRKELILIFLFTTVPFKALFDQVLH